MSFEKPENSSETETQRAFSELRSKFYDGEKQSVKERAEKNPTPTDHELRIGAYEEEVEPQMRPILKALYEKGYTTESSGFGGIDNPEIQQVDGYYEIDEATEEKLKQLGAWITRERSDYYHDTLTRIEFKADEPDEDKIIKKWEEIVSMLPAIGKPSYSLSAPSFEFQQKHMGEDEARRIHIETLLERGHMPDDEREGAEQWLKEHPSTESDSESSEAVTPKSTRDKILESHPELAEIYNKRSGKGEIIVGVSEHMRSLMDLADAIQEALPAVQDGYVRLWRGNREDEIGQNPSYTNSLAGIALPFLGGYGGALSYVDVRASETDKYLQTGAVAEGAEFILPAEIVKEAKIVGFTPEQANEIKGRAKSKQESGPSGFDSPVG